MTLDQLLSTEREPTRPLQIDLSSQPVKSESSRQPVPALDSKPIVLVEQKVSAPATAPKVEIEQRQPTQQPSSIRPSSSPDTKASVQARTVLPPSTDKESVNASSIIQGAIQQGDPKLHAALISQAPTVSVGIEQLRDWYVAVQAQQKHSNLERLAAIKEKGVEAAPTGHTSLAPSEAQNMERDIEQFTNTRAETTIDSLRAWYRANLAGDRSQLSNIKKLAEAAKSSGNSSVQLRPTDQIRMEKEVGSLQTQIVSQIEPNLRSIWSIAISNQLTGPHAEDKTIFSGQHYSIVSSKDDVLTLIHNATESKLSISQSGDVLENGLTLKHAEEIQAIAQKMTQIISNNQRSQMQA